MTVTIMTLITKIYRINDTQHIGVQHNGTHHYNNMPFSRDSGLNFTWNFSIFNAFKIESIKSFFSNFVGSLWFIKYWTAESRKSLAIFKLFITSVLISQKASFFAPVALRPGANVINLFWSGFSYKARVFVRLGLKSLPGTNKTL